MKERPILFSAPMVRAILAGTKTQTRRLVKAKQFPAPFHGRCAEVGVATALREMHEQGFWGGRPFPYGRPGDRLWVREAFMPAPEGRPGRWSIAYAADGMHCDFTAPSAYNPMLYNYERWSPSIHMPRWASRITLEVTGVRVERLQEISEEDARAEGVKQPSSGCWLDYEGGDLPHLSARDSFASLWRSINGAESWDLNPWVWVISFKRVTP